MSTPGFTDVNFEQSFTASATYNTDVVPGVPAFSFKFPLSVFVDSNGNQWPADQFLIESAIIDEVMGTATLRVLPNTEWLIYGAYLYAFPSTVLFADIANTKLTVWRVDDTSQDYLGTAWIATTPKDIAAQADKAMRTAQRALEMAFRSFQVHKLDPDLNAFTGRETHSDFVLPPVSSRAGKVIGFDSNGDPGYFINASAGGVSTPDPNTLVQRDGSGRAQFADPSASQDAATKIWVQAQIAAAPISNLIYDMLYNFQGVI